MATRAAPSVTRMVPTKNTLGWPYRSPRRAPINTVLPRTIKLTMMIQAASCRLTSKCRATLGKASVTGMLESWTKSWPEVMASNTSRRDRLLTTSL